MFDQFEETIREEAVADYPLEAVWLITEKGCTKVKNVHADPENHFKVGKKAMAKAMSEGLLAVVHSHPDRPDVPTAADMQGQVNTAVPWGVLSCDSESAGKIRWWGQEDRPDLVGRPFVHGVTDCYALIRDYYKKEVEVSLPEFPRSWGWWEEGQNLFMEGFAKAGFREIPPAEVEPGDVWLAKIRSETVNHGGILLEGGLMLHQIGSPSGPIDNSRLSAAEPMSRYMPFVVCWLRHEG